MLTHTQIKNISIINQSELELGSGITAQRLAHAQETIDLSAKTTTQI